MDNSMRYIKALAKMADRAFKQQFHFSAETVTKVDPDTGLCSTNRGYGTGSQDIGTTSDSRPQHGDSIIKLGSQNGWSIPFNGGSSGWITG